MAEALTAGYKLYNGTVAAGDLIGIVREISVTYEGNNEEVSGLSDVEGGIIRSKNLPVDVDASLSISGIVDREAAGYDAFDSAMKARTKDSVLGVERPNGDAVNYTGHSNTYDPETVTRDEASVKFSLDFQVNSDEFVAAT
jgi:hypothetical protein